MALAEGLRRFKAKSMTKLDAIVTETVREFSGSLVSDWTPYGNPELWKSPPPAGYSPGNLQSSWFLSVGAASAEVTTSTTSRTINGWERMPEHPAGQLIYLSNSAPHASSIEAGHSSQSPVGIMWSAAEFPYIAEAIARRHA